MMVHFMCQLDWAMVFRYLVLVLYVSVRVFVHEIYI